MTCQSLPSGEAKGVSTPATPTRQNHNNFTGKTRFNEVRRGVCQVVATPALSIWRNMFTNTPVVQIAYSGVAICNMQCVIFRESKIRLECSYEHP
jgi:hypothetical protein